MRREGEGQAYLASLVDQATTHVFDVDHTLTRHSTGRRFAQAGLADRTFRWHDFISMPWFYLRYRIGRLQLSDITREIRPMAGLARERITDLADMAWWSHVRSDLFPHAREHLNRCRARERRLVLLSTSIDLLLTPIAGHLGVDKTIASVLEFEDDICSGWIVGGPCYAQEKWRRLKHYLDEVGERPERCAFYSDSFHDLPTFVEVAFPVPVNPDLVLRRHARNANWPIVRW